MTDPVWLRAAAGPERLHLAHHVRVGALSSARMRVTWCGAVFSDRASNPETPTPERDLCRDCLAALDTYSSGVTKTVADLRYARSQREAQVYAGIPAADRVLGAGAAS